MWTCTFADDFSGHTLDPDNWSPLTTSGVEGRSAECRVDSPANIAVSDGLLRLTARRLDQAVTCRSRTDSYRTAYTAGAVTTHRHFAQAYGRVEIRAAMPAHRGVGFHSALWMYPQHESYGAWPASGEIDIAEYRTGLVGRAVPTLHLVSRGEQRVVTNWRCAVADPQRFHSYVLVWTPAMIRFEYDGSVCLVQRFDPQRPWTAKPFDRPFFLILNQSFGIGPNAPTARTPDSATMAIDYIKIWR